LKQALPYIDGDIIDSPFTRNCHSPSECSFQAELYCGFRSILPHGSMIECTQYRVHFEVRSSGCLNILLANGKRFSYECKVNKLQTTEIIDGKKQANKYRKAVKAEEMCLVNFIPEGHQMDEEMFPSEYPKVHVISFMIDSVLNSSCVQPRTSG